MADRRQIIATAIKEMTFGELTDMAADMQDAFNVAWRTTGDEAFGPIDFASAIHSWAEAQEMDGAELPGVAHG